jgi:hypothetical protein
MMSRDRNGFIGAAARKFAQPAPLRTFPEQYRRLEQDDF